MTVLTANEAVQDFLRGVIQPVEIRDASGQVLGKYTPIVPQEVAELYEKARKLFDEGEMERRLAEEHGKGHTFEEVMQHLKSLETSQ